MHDPTMQARIAREAAITGIIDGGAALCGTVLAIEMTIFNILMGYATPSITSLLAIALGSLITAGLLIGGIFFLRGRGYKTLLTTTLCQIFFLRYAISH